MSEKSFLTLYSLEVTGVDELELEEANRFVKDNYGTKAICRNIFEFKVPAEVLAEEIEALLEINDDLRRDIGREKMTGSNYIFVQPPNQPAQWGKPLDSIDLDE